MGDNFLDLADAYRQEKVNFLKLLLEKQDEEDKTLADMKQYQIRDLRGRIASEVCVPVACLLRTSQSLTTSLPPWSSPSS